MGRRKIGVDQGICIGCGSCVGLYPEDFELTSDGLAECISGEAEEDAADCCPVGAIAIED